MFRRMKILTQETSMKVSEITELTSANALAFRDEVRAALRPGHTLLDIDCSQTGLLDSSGLGALIGLHKTMSGQQGRLRVVNPTSMVQQVLELTRLHQVLEITRT